MFDVQHVEFRSGAGYPNPSPQQMMMAAADIETPFPSIIHTQDWVGPVLEQNTGQFML